MKARRFGWQGAGMADTVQAYWDSQAATFDDEPDHGLRALGIRDAWRRLLLQHLPPAPADVLDLGCGTGTLSVLLAGCGYRVHGLDLAPAMVEAARRKATAGGVEASFRVGDAAEPPYPPGSADVVLARHVLWALGDPSGALSRWIALLRPGGRLVLVEGRWSTGGGIPAAECERLVTEHCSTVEVRHLTDSRFWGRPIDDERYLLVGRR